jgi:hypothetical protein
MRQYDSPNAERATVSTTKLMDGPIHGFESKVTSFVRMQRIL